MFRWSQIPLIRLIFPFIIGILLQPKSSVDSNTFLIVFSFLAVFSLITIRFKLRYQFRWALGILYYFTVFIGGLTAASYYSNPKQIINSNNENCYFAQVVDHPEEKEKTYKLSLRLYSNSEDIKAVDIIAYAAKDSIIEKLSVGDYILFNGKLSQIEGKRNPATFDYANYLANKNIIYQSYLSTGSWKKVSLPLGFTPLIWAKKLQRAIRGLFNKYLLSDSTKAILFALVLGDKTELDGDLNSSFAVAGAMHILAVSGLHVGIIYKVLESLLILLFSGRSKRFIRAVLLISALWLYAFVTGLSPSVLRAVLMFSFIIAAKARENSPNFYNTLAASAFIILIVEPNYIYHVGFQLSYSAVIAIVSIFPLIYPFFVTKNRIANSVISLAIVSIAAQIGTAPFSIYYFHQFPSYFIITNLIAIPAAFLLLSGGLLLIPFHFISFDLSKFIGLLIDWIGEMLSNLITWISHLPMASLNKLWIDQAQLVMFYLFLSVTVYTFTNLWKRGILLSLSLIAIILIQFVVVEINQEQQEFVILYSTKGANVIGLVKGNEAYIYSDNDSIQHTKEWSFQVQPSLDSLKLKNVSFKAGDFDWVQINTLAKNKLINSTFKKIYIRNNQFFDEFMARHEEISIVENNSTIPSLNVDERLRFISSANSWKQIKEISEDTSKHSIHKLYLSHAIITNTPLQVNP